MVAHDVLKTQENPQKDDALFLFRGCMLLGRDKWPSKNHANPLMASCLSRHYKPASGCHPFGIVMNEPSATFTLLKPGATGSSVGVAGAVPGLRSGSTGGCGRLAPEILAGARGGF